MLTLPWNWRCKCILHSHEAAMSGSANNGTFTATPAHRTRPGDRGSGWRQESGWDHWRRLARHQAPVDRGDGPWVHLLVAGRPRPSVLRHMEQAYGNLGMGLAAMAPRRANGSAATGRERGGSIPPPSATMTPGAAVRPQPAHVQWQPRLRRVSRRDAAPARRRTEGILGSFLDRLRFAKDKAEFDQFMAERRNRPPTPPEPPQA